MSGLRNIDIVSIVYMEWVGGGCEASMPPLSRLHPKAVSCGSCSPHTLERGWCASLTGSLISHIYSVRSDNGRMPVLFQPGTPPRSCWTRLMTDGWRFIYGPLCFIQASINQPRILSSDYSLKSHIYPQNLSGTRRHSFEGVLCSN